MAFDLYFAGTGHRGVHEFLTSQGACRLFSQLIDRGGIKKFLDEDSFGAKLFVDSGAYTAYTKGVTVDVDEYIKYVESIIDKVTIFAQVDKIPGQFRKPKSNKDVLEAPYESWENYLYMRERCSQPDKLVPIFHQGENWKWLENMLEWTDSEGHHIPYIGISPAVDVPGIEDFLTKSFDIIEKSSNPHVKTHAFGMTRLNLLEKYPYTSADSTSWILNGAMGSILTPWGRVYVSDRREHDLNYIENQPLEAKQKIINYVEENGYTFEEVKESYFIRQLINIKYLLNWAANYEYKGYKSHHNRLF